MVPPCLLLITAIRGIPLGFYKLFSLLPEAPGRYPLQRSHIISQTTISYKNLHYSKNNVISSPNCIPKAITLYGNIPFLIGVSNSPSQLKKIPCSLNCRGFFIFNFYYFIISKPRSAIRLPISLRLKSSRSFKKIAAAINTMTILNVVTAETTLRFPTIFISTT